MYTNLGGSIFLGGVIFEPNLHPTNLPVNNNMAATDVLYEEILNKKPTLEELCELVPISTKWYQMGILLKLNVKKLNEIEEESKKTTDKVLKMYELWLDTNPQATRQQIVETLKMDAIEENTLAQNYETKLRELHSKTGKSMSQII